MSYHVVKANEVLLKAAKEGTQANATLCKLAAVEGKERGRERSGNIRNQQLVEFPVQEFSYPVNQ
jgi:hypothetical protein